MLSGPENVCVCVRVLVDDFLYNAT